MLALRELLIEWFVVAVTRSLRPAAEERAINSVVATAMAEAFNYRSTDSLRLAADGVLEVCHTTLQKASPLWYRDACTQASAVKKLVGPLSVAEENISGNSRHTLDVLGCEDCA